MEEYKKTAEAWKRKCEKDPDNAALRQGYALFLLEYMKETRIPVLTCSPLFDVKHILEKAAEAEEGDIRIRTLRNRAYKSVAAEAAAGRASLYEAALPLVQNDTLDYEAWKQALTNTAPALSRILKAGEAAARELVSRGIRYDRNPGSMCWTLVEPQKGHSILTPVFALCDLLIASETPEDPGSMEVIRLPEPAYDAEDFYSRAADQAVDQWNDLKYCPYCFKTDLRMTMSGRRRCKACRAVIKPFEVYRPQ